MTPEIYQNRRRALRALMSEEERARALLLVGHGESPRNYAANAYRFRQDSHLLYYTGINAPNLALLMLPDGRDVLFGPPPHPDDIIWCGPGPSLEERAAGAGLSGTAPRAKLAGHLARLAESGVESHYPPPYRAETVLDLMGLLGRSLEEVRGGYSPSLIRCIAEQRAIKTEEEVAQIEDALGVTALMFASVALEVRPGRREADIAGAMQGVALAHDREQSFPPIVTVRGEILHNSGYGNVLSAGDLLVVDCGAESPLGYASDITRTFPVGESLEGGRRDLYDIVLAAQAAVIEAVRPGVSYREMHLLAARVIADGLHGLGLIRGDVSEAVEAGAHALFFPHGIGHMLGLDAHDMEDLGDVVGYGAEGERSAQFGLSALRLARTLEVGHVVTVEPGIYFNPPLIDRWRAAKRLEEFIDYSAVASFIGIGGIRIEDDLLITDGGARVLGPPIPKTGR